MSSGRSTTSVAKELGLRDSVLRRWIDKLRRELTSALWRPTSHATPISADQARNSIGYVQENDRLRMERDIFKTVDLGGTWTELLLHRGLPRRLAEETDVHCGRGLSGRL